MMRMAAVGESEDELELWWLVDIAAVLSCTASLLTRTAALFRPGKEKLKTRTSRLKLVSFVVFNFYT